MTATVVKITQFTGAGKVFTRDSDGLAAIVRGIAIDNARTKIESAGVPGLTDNSGGTAAPAYAGAPLPVTAIDATSAGGASAAALNTSLGKQSNALRVLTNSVNNALARLGLPVVTNPYGTQASANTIPAQDLAGTGASGASAADFQSTVNALTIVRANFTRVAHAVNNVLAAIGENRLSRSVYGPEPQDRSVAAVPTVVASTAGPSSAALADVTAFLDGLADDIATLALAWNDEMDGAAITVITDSTGGTAAAALAVDAVPAAAIGAATTSAPKAGFDTQLALINNACASLAAKANVLLDEYELPTLTNSTGGTVSNTLAAESVALTAVDGSTGTVAVDVVSATASMELVANNLSSIGAQLNVLAPYFGVQPLGADALAGAVSSVIAAVPATAGGVGAGTAVTMLNAAVDSWLTTNRNNISTLAAMLNSMLGTNAPGVGLHVVAG